MEHFPVRLEACQAALACEVSHVSAHFTLRVTDDFLQPTRRGSCAVSLQIRHLPLRIGA